MNKHVGVGDAENVAEPKTGRARICRARIWSKCSKCHKETRSAASIAQVTELARQDGWEVVGEFKTENGEVGGCRLMFCPDCQG